MDTNDTAGISGKDPVLNAGDMIILFVRRNWRFLIVGYAICALLGGGFYGLAQKQYAGWIIITPSQRGNEFSGAGGLSAISSLAGIDIPHGLGRDRQDQYFTLLRSMTVARELSKRSDLLKMMFPGDWKRKTQSWKQRGGVSTWVKENIFGIKYPDFPSVEDVYNYLRSHVEIDELKTGSVWMVKVYTPNPVFSREIIAAVNNAADETLRMISLSIYNRKLAYISKRLEEIRETSVREALIHIQEDNLRAQVALESGAPIAFTVIEGPVSESIPSKPNLIFIVFVIEIIFSISVAILAVMGKGRNSLITLARKLIRWLVR